MLSRPEIARLIARMTSLESDSRPTVTELLEGPFSSQAGRVRELEVQLQQREEEVAWLRMRVQQQEGEFDRRGREIDRLNGVLKLAVTSEK